MVAPAHIARGQLIPPNADVNQAGSDIMLPEINVNAGLERGHSPVQGYLAPVSSTATKTDTPLIETPQSLSVVTRDQVEALGAQNLNQILRYSPAVIPDTRGSTAVRLDQFSVRGFTQPQFLDGMRLFGGRDANPSVDPYRLERVEVLRGPASVLYGQSGPAGLVNLVTKRPTFDPYREILLQGGSFGHFRAGVDLSGALNENRTVFGRIVGSYSESDTQTDRVREQRYLIAPSLTLRPSDDTTITFLGHFQSDPYGGSYGAAPAWGTVLSNPNGRIRRGYYDGDERFEQSDRQQYGLGYLAEHRFNDTFTVRQNFRYLRTEGIYASLYTPSSGQLQSDLRTQRRATIGSDASFDIFTLDNQLETRFQTGPLQHTLLTGLDYYVVNSQTYNGSGTGPSIDIFNPTYGQPVAPINYSTRARQAQSSLGLYAQDQIRLGRLAIQVGGRYDRYDSETRNLTIASNAVTRTDQEDTAFTGRAGLVYLFDSGFAPYASYSESFEPQGGTTAPARGLQPFDPTTGRQYEVGLRYQPPGMKALFSVAAFDLVRQNVLTADPLYPTFSVQSGEVRSRGVEFEARGRLAPGLDLTAAYAYLENERSSGNGALTNNLGVIGSRMVSRAEKGSHPVGIPRHTASVFANYTFQPASLLDGFAMGGGVRYVGSSWGDAANTLKVPGYTLVDLVARYDLSKFAPGLSGTQLQVNVTNLFDKEHVTSCFNYAWCWYGYRRSVVATMRHRF
jgi:iron complex outermembrane receptor protein